MVPPLRGEPEQVRRPLWKYVWNTSPKNTAASTPCGISPLRRRSVVLWKFRKPNVHIWQYDEAGLVWTGSKIDKFVKSSEIVNIFRLVVDILQNFWYCDGTRKVVPTLGKQVIPDGLMCSGRGATSFNPSFAIYFTIDTVPSYAFVSHDIRGGTVAPSGYSCYTEAPISI